MDRCVGPQHDPRALGHIRFFYALSILLSSKGGRSILGADSAVTARVYMWWSLADLPAVRASHGEREARRRRSR